MIFMNAAHTNFAESALWACGFLAAYGLGVWGMKAHVDRQEKRDGQRK